jgi:DNA-binding PadR family transcriptional regulator
MNQKNFKQTDSKELGSLQQEILFYLAENPDNHKQGIQQGIDHPADQYGSIVKAVNALEKMLYIQSENATSQKNLEIKIYSCTQLGIFYSIAKNNHANIPKILKAYGNRIEHCKALKQLYDLWGHDCFSIYLKDAADIIPIVQKEGFEAAFPHLLMKALKQQKIIDPKTRVKNAKGALKLSPKSREMFEELQKNLDELLR